MRIDLPLCNLKTCRYCHDHNCFSADYERCEYTLEKRPHGEWIPIKNRKGTVVALRCSACGQSPKYAIKSDFCPRCGADMRIKNVRSWDTSSRGVSGSVENSITQKEGEEK